MIVGDSACLQEGTALGNDGVFPFRAVSHFNEPDRYNGSTFSSVPPAKEHFFRNNILPFVNILGYFSAAAKNTRRTSAVLRLFAILLVNSRGRSGRIPPPPGGTAFLILCMGGTFPPLRFVIRVRSLFIQNRETEDHTSGNPCTSKNHHCRHSGIFDNLWCFMPIEPFSMVLTCHVLKFPR